MRISKIKVFHTAPVALMPKLEPFQDFLFIEAAIALENPAYKDYILKLKASNPSLYIVMDNSAYLLGHAMPEKAFMKAYELFTPDCIIALDHPYDMQRTLDLTEAFIDKYSTRIDAKFMGVPQGSTFAKYMVCYNYMQKIDRISVIGINMFMDWGHPSLRKVEKTKRIYYNRATIMTLIHEVMVKSIKEKSPGPKAVHLLGLTLGKELHYAMQHNLYTITSCDSSSAFIHGHQGICYTKRGLKEKDWVNKMDFNITKIDPLQKQCILHNIKIIDKLRRA